jgi:WXG100 family type VII secretion target
MATVTRLEVDTSRLRKDIDSLRTHLDGLRKTGDSMMAGINALNSMWEGEAKEAFVAQFQTDYEILQSMAEVIESLIKNLEEAGRQYDTCEGNVGSIISAIRI